MNEAAPTVIVARKVKSGCDEQMQDWQVRLLEAASEADGYLGSLVQPPDGAHPEEWVTIYRFDTRSNLDDWLGSRVRSKLMDEVDDLVSGPTREQRIAQPHPGAVTAVMSNRVDPNQLEVYRQTHDRLVYTMSQFPGYIRAQNSEPVPGIQEDYVTVFSFETRENLDNWLKSSERADELEKLVPFVEGAGVLNVVDGFSGWFGVTSEKMAPLWKQAVTVLIALYPTTLTLAWIQSKIMPDMHWVPAMFISNVVGIAILTWILMPVVTKALAGWLKA